MSAPLSLARLISIHLALECIGLDENNDLIRIACENPDTLHRVYVARHADGDSYFFRSDLPTDLRSKLKSIPAEEYFSTTTLIQSILDENGPCDEIHTGRSYIFSHTLGPSDYPDVVMLSQLEPRVVEHYDPELVRSKQEVFCLICDGQIVSTCESSRENFYAGEAWVRTLPDYSRRGFARQVTAAWGNSLLAQGKIPFYSHKWDNSASQAVAQSLNLTQYIADAGYA